MNTPQSYIEEILKNVPQEERDDTLAFLGEQILRRTFLVIYDQIPEDKLSIFEAMRQTASLDELYTFLRDIPGLEAKLEGIITEVLEEFKTVK